MTSFFHTMKQCIPVSVKARILYHLSSSRDDCFQHYRGKRKVIVALAADYANLGDVAITHAQAHFLQAALPDHEIVFFSCAATFVHLKSLKRVCTPDDIITIVGGGNMGDLYDSLEDARRFVIEQFPNNRIISFPQTIDFSDTPKGRRELRKTERAYRRHPDLHLFAREPASFEKMKHSFPANPVHLVPDIVLSLDTPEVDQPRHGVLLCIRDDAESALSSESRADFVNRMTSSIAGVTVTDTMSNVSERLPIVERVAELKTLLSSFRRSEMVVTDRLHGMIFAAITGTPCLVLLNNNHKIKATYNAWLSTMSHIRLQKSFNADQILKTVVELRSHDIKIKKPHLDAHYDSLKRLITGQYL